MLCGKINFGGGSSLICTHVQTLILVGGSPFINLKSARGCPLAGVLYVLALAYTSEYTISMAFDMSWVVFGDVLFALAVILYFYTKMRRSRGDMLASMLYVYIHN